VHIGICELYRNKEGGPKDQQGGIKHFYCGPNISILIVFHIISYLIYFYISRTRRHHELGVTRPNFLPLFNPVARKSIEMTIDMLSATSIDYIKKFPNVIVKDDLRIVHGFPPESPTKYLFELSDDEIQDSLEKMVESYCFIGHTHDLEILILENDRLTRRPLEKGIFTLNPNNKHIVNSGSVGQPRDGNSQAKYVIWNSDNKELAVRYITYNISDTVKKIYKAGLPEQHALRLM